MSDDDSSKSEKSAGDDEYLDDDYNEDLENDKNNILFTDDAFRIPRK